MLIVKLLITVILIGQLELTMIFTNFRVIVMVKENPYAKVTFDTQGKNPLGGLSGKG